MIQNLDVFLWNRPGRMDSINELHNIVFFNYPIIQLFPAHISCEIQSAA